MKKKVFAILTVCALMACLAVPAFAVEGTVTPVTYNSFSDVITTLQQQISVSTVVQLLVSLATICVGFVFMWWGVRKITGALMSAFRKGKLSI